MNTEKLINKHLVDIVNDARFAPSVHNTQPWSIQASGGSIIVDIVDSQKLSDGDPTGRETIISLGIIAEALAMAARQRGLQVNTTTLSADNRAVLNFRTDTNPKSARDNIALLKQRVTDRSIYKPTSIPHDRLLYLESLSSDSSVTVHTTTDKEIIKKVANLTAQGIGVALTSPGFRRELSQYLIEPWSHKKRGISLMSLYIPWLIAVLEPWLMRLGVGRSAEVRLEKRRWLSSSGIVCITANGDMPRYWFETGRTYLRIALEVEYMGLSQATSAATVEASTFHEDIEELLDTRQRLLAVIRIGKGRSKRAHSPRAQAEDLIVT